jgi:hypothetical protein
MCRSIKVLYNFDPPATDAEIQAAATQFVRKLSGFQKPSSANAQAFEQAIAGTVKIAQRLLDELVTAAEPRNRNIEAARAKARAVKRFGTVS